MKKVLMYGVVLFLGALAVGQELKLYQLSNNTRIDNLTLGEAELIKVIRNMKKNGLQNNNGANQILQEKFEQVFRNQDVDSQNSEILSRGADTPGV